MEKLIMVWDTEIIVSIVEDPFPVVPLSLDVDETIFVVSFKLFVLEYVDVAVVSDFVKVIHIQLSDKRCEIFVSEVDRQNLFLKLFDIVNDEVASFLVPRDDALVLRILR